MTFLWPSMLLSLLALPLVITLYLRVDRRRQEQAAHMGNGQPAGKQAPGFRRHIPPALFLLSLAISLVALARPQAQVRLPRVEGTVVLLFDVSASMGADDVQPSRIEVAKVAARQFVLSQPSTVKIGVVSFSGSGFAVQTPTNDANDLVAAINRLKPTSGTSLGQGILVALHTIAVDAGLMPADKIAAADQSQPAGTPNAEDAQQAGPRDNELLVQLPEGSYPSAVIVILSDGENNQSIDPLEAAQAAADHDVRIDALGFGTTAGTIIQVDGFSVHTALDEAMLQQISQAAGGEYFAAQGEQDPQDIYAHLSPQLVVKSENMEITSMFAGASLLILVIGSILSMLWFNRLV